jgi:NTE family protein
MAPLKKTRHKKGTTGGRKKINIALQGGGSHGAFAWGVLDYFLEDERIDFEGVCATSAGALNAVGLAYGLTIGDRQTARDVLTKIWKTCSDLGNLYSPVKPSPVNFPTMFSDEKEKSIQEEFSFSMFELVTNAMSPYQFNPFNINPLRQIIESCVDMKVLRKCDKLNLFITATDVYSGKARVFTNEEMSTEVVLASAALPFLFQAVEIKGRPYWDGGYVGNPSLWPLFYDTRTLDLCVIHINPIERYQLPKSSYEITNRINEITFNTSLLAEMRSIAFVNKLLDEDWLKPKYKNRLQNIRLHAIRADHVLRDFSVGSKFQTDWPFLLAMRDYGRAAAHSWLHKNYDALGHKATVDIHDEFLTQLAGKV